MKNSQFNGFWVRTFEAIRDTIKLAVYVVKYLLNRFWAGIY